MTPEKGTKAHQAYQLGWNAFAQGSTIDDNPYVLSRVIALSLWWLKGYYDCAIDLSVE